MRSSILMLVLLGVAQLTGCTGMKMMPAASQTLAPLKSDESRIVFMRSASHGTGVEAGIYEVVNDKPEFIGILLNDNKLYVDTTPGEHVYMSMGANLRFLKANMRKGKTYYVMLVPRGSPVVNFSLYPFRAHGTGGFSLGSKEFNDWLSNTLLVEVGPDARRWAKDIAPRVRENIMTEWPQWLSKSDSSKIDNTLNPGDGL